MNSKLIGISGAARSGKDTFCRVLSQMIPSIGRYSFADDLKKDLSEFVWKNYGIDIFDMSQKEKNDIRPLMVFHGEYMRDQTEGLHWIEKVKNDIEKNEDDISVVTDVRFPNEMNFFKENGGSLLYIERFDSRGGIIAPANLQEERNCPFLKKNADYVLRWDTTNNESTLREYVEKAIFESGIFANA